MSDFGDIDALAAEFVIGTLDRDERAAVELRLPSDKALQRAIAEWEWRLAPLGHVGGEVAPSPELWARIERTISGQASASLRVVDGGLRPGAGPVAKVAGPAIKRSRDRWRALALATSGIAAALAAFVFVRDVAVQPETAATYVAAVNRGGDKPALIVTVDLKSRRVLVRPVDATTPSGHSLQLWYIGAKQAPRSMGLVGDNVSTAALPAGAPADATATFAVSLEPTGGSTTGGPTGAVLYAGQLVPQ